MKYKVLTLELTSLKLQEHKLKWSKSYIPYSWHHCTYNRTSSDVVPVIYLRVDNTVPTTEQAVMQYQLLTIELTLLYLKQHYMWCYTSSLTKSWHHSTYNRTSSDVVPVT